MKKALLVLLVMTVVLGLAAPVAASFTDTSGNADRQYIDKASALGWLKGYPDGTFKPSGNVTRAEMAAALVRALGLEVAASSTSGLSTKYSDVPSTNWAAGYINIASNKGVIKGYPDGTFKPDANVTNAEAITMIVRALNRESDATGDWPVGHIMVAAQQQIITGSFNTNALATRADVARFLARAATVPWKELTSSGWVESTANPQASFVKASGLVKFSGVVTDVKSTTKAMTINETTPSTGLFTFTMDDNAVIGGGTSFLDLRGYSVDIYQNKDTTKIVYVEPSMDVTLIKGDIRSISSEGSNPVIWRINLYNDTRTYNAYVYTSGGTSAVAVRNGVNSTLGAFQVDDTVSLFIGSTGSVSYVNGRGFDYVRYVISDLYTAGTPQSVTIRRAQSSTMTFSVNSDTKIEIDGVEKKISDLVKGDVVSVAVDPTSNSYATIIEASSKQITGKTTSKRKIESDELTAYYMSIDGVEYRFETTAEIKDNETYNTPAKMFGEVTGLASAIKVGQTVTVTMSRRDRIAVVEVVSGIADMGKIKQFVVGTSGSYDSWVLDMKGTQQSYEVAHATATGTSLHSALIGAYYNGLVNGTNFYNQIQYGTVANANIGRVLRPGDFVALTIDTDGRVTGAELLVNPEGNRIADNPAYSPAFSLVKLGDVYSTDKLVTISGGAYVVTTDTLLYVNGLSASMSSVSKDAYAAVAFRTGADAIKLKALVVDTFATMDTTAMIVTSGGTMLKGYDHAAEPWSFVAVLNGSTVIGSGYADDSGGNTPSFDTYRPTASQNSGYYGGFVIPLSPAPSSGTVLTVKVTDTFGNTTTGQVKVP
jgi:hypothetical protein